MKNTLKIAFCGVIAALSVVIMFLTGVVPIATIAIPALAGCLLIPVVAECGIKWGAGVFGVVSLLAFFLTTDREAFLIYLLFFGYYPVLYATLDKIKSKVLKYALKFIIFNLAAVGETLIVTFVFGIPFETISFLGAFTPVVLLILANITFILYDYALKGLIIMYFAKLHKTAARLLKGK